MIKSGQSSSTTTARSSSKRAKPRRSGSSDKDGSGSHPVKKQKVEDVNNNGSDTSDVSGSDEEITRILHSKKQSAPVTNVNVATDNNEMSPNTKQDLLHQHQQQLYHHRRQHQGQKHRRTNPNHMYNIKVHRELLDGICSGCLGDRDDTASATDEPVLLCDGKGCLREYHLRCIPHKDPPLQRVPQGNFYCIDCDPAGTSAALELYFDDVEIDRTKFGCSKLYVEAMIRDGMQQGPAFGKVHGPMDPPVSELQRIEELHLAAMDDSQFRREYADVNVNVDTGRGAGTAKKSNSSGSWDGFFHSSDSSSSQSQNPTPTQSQKQNTNHNKTAKSGNNGKPNNKSKGANNATVTDYSINSNDPELLVGNIIKMYCAKDDSYHTGRIIDWRSAVPPGSDPATAATKFYGTGAIATTEYLALFSKGHDGRKKTVYRWVILEEHSCAVGLSIAMALKDKGRGLNGWKPAHVLYRTCLELVPVRNLLIPAHPDNRWGFVIYFGSTSNMYINLAAEAADFFSDTFKLLREKKTVVSLTPSMKKPKNYDSQVALMGMALVSARMEIEERRRAFRWHTLPLQNRYHDKALTIINEKSFDLMLEMTDEEGEGDGGSNPSSAAKENESNNVNVSVDEEEEEEEKKESPHDAKTTTKNESNVQGLGIGLCPLIQQGLDKSWIASLLSKVSNEHTLDSMASMKARIPLQPACVTMAHYNEKYSRKK